MCRSSRSARRHEGEAHYPAVGMPEAGERQRHDGEMRLPGRHAIRGVPRHDLRDRVSQPRATIPAHQRSPQCAADQRGSADVGDFAVDGFEHQPV